MQDIKQKLQEVFILYQKNQYEEAKKINDEILAKYPENSYAKKYDTLLQSRISTHSHKEKVRVKWKSLKCPHCQAQIWFSALSEEQKNAIDKWEYDNLELKCPYCHTKFTLQKRKANSMLWLKIWDIATIDGNKYRTVWYIKYKGKRTTLSWWSVESYWWLDYLEWILLGWDNSYYYFSEWISTFSRGREEEFELSKKIIPSFSLKPNYDMRYVEIDNKKIYMEEIDEVKTESIYGENSKVFTIWEKVELYVFKVWGREYVIEKEQAGTQSEAGVYESWEISRKDAFKMFGKSYTRTYNNVSQNTFSQKILPYLFIGMFLLLSVFPRISLLIFIFLIVFYVFKVDFNSKLGKTILFGFIIWPLFTFLIASPLFTAIENKTQISLEDVSEWKHQIIFENKDLMKEEVVKTRSYDYGWVRTYYQQNTWVKFKIGSVEDKEIIENIKDIIYENIDLTNLVDIEKTNIKSIFSENIYKIE